jgi:hypothetical protein
MMLGQQFFEDWPLLHVERKANWNRPARPGCSIERLMQTAIAARALALDRRHADGAFGLPSTRATRRNRQDELAQSFSEHFDATADYGAAMHSLCRVWLRNVAKAAPTLFDGTGSFGNGAAMRVAPIGAYFADDIEAAIEKARRSAEVTHSHEEGIAGAVAIAVAAATSMALGASFKCSGVRRFSDLILPIFPKVKCDVAPLWRATWLMKRCKRLRTSWVVVLKFRRKIPSRFACGARASHMEHWEETLWLTVAGLGDRDYDLRYRRRHRHSATVAFREHSTVAGLKRASPCRSGLLALNSSIVRRCPFSSKGIFMAGNLQQLQRREYSGNPRLRIGHALMVAYRIADERRKRMDAR